MGKHIWRGVRPWQRHSLVLAVAGLGHIAVGLTYIFPAQTQAREVALAFALNVMPLGAWGGLFVASGVLAIISSRWPPFSVTWGYTVLTAMASAWASFYAAGIFFGQAPFSSLSGVFIWGLMGFMWWAISGLLNPELIIREVLDVEL